MQSVFLCSIQKYRRLVAVTLDLQHIPGSKYLCDGLLSFPTFPRAASLLHCWACVSECWSGNAEGSWKCTPILPLSAFPIHILAESGDKLITLLQGICVAALTKKEK